MSTQDQNLIISESYVQIKNINTDEERRYRIGDVEPYETFTDNIGRLFRSLQREYGRCVSSMYVDLPNGEIKRIGWVFRKREEYSDWRPSSRFDRYYVREVWIALHDSLPEHRTTYHYHELPMDD